MTLLQIILATSVIASFSLIGLAVLLKVRKHFHDGLLGFVALAAGTMLGSAFLHLLPEAVEMSNHGEISLYSVMALTLVAFVGSYLFEQYFSWHSCHHNPETCDHEKPYANLVIFSDAIHNFIDGLIIAAAFIVSPALGITTAVAVALHEIPQELGDFAVLIHSGWKVKKAALANAGAALTVVLGGVVGYYLTQTFEMAAPIMLPIAAGGFIYIAAADLLPELKHQVDRKKLSLNVFIFLLGIAIMVVASMTHSHEAHGHDHGAHEHEYEQEVEGHEHADEFEVHVHEDEHDDHDHDHDEHTH